MRKEYKLDESTGEFRIVNLPDGRKNIILADGTDVAKRMGVSGIDKIGFHEVNKNGKTARIYICETVPKTYKWIVSDKDGGKFLNVPLLDVDVYANRLGIRIETSTICKETNRGMRCLLDLDLKSISLGCHAYIVNGFEWSIIVTDYDRGDDGCENVVDIKNNKYLFDKWYRSIDTLNGVGCFRCEVDDMMCILADKNGTILTEDPIRHIDSLSNVYYKDNFGGESNKIDFVITTDEYDYQTLFSVNDNKLEKYPVMNNGKEIESGRYDVEEGGLPNDSVFLIKSDSGMNWIGYDGKMALKSGADEIVDKSDMFDGKAFIVKRDEKYNIIGMKSMVPLFSDEEWADQFTIIRNEKYSYNTIALKRDGKCNLISMLYPWKLCLKDWADNILVSDDNFIYVKYENETYIFIKNTLMRCSRHVIGQNGIMFIYDWRFKEWNAICIESDDPSELTKEGFDNIYDVNSFFPIVERKGKFAFFDTELGEIVPNKKEYSTNIKTGKIYESSVEYIWFDDVEPFDEDNKDWKENDEPTFEVYKNGEKYFSDEDGNLTKTESQEK